MEILAVCGRDAYYLATVAALNGRPRASRGLVARDAGFTSILMESSIDAFPIGIRPRLSKAIAAAEALQLIAGYATPKLMFAIAPQFRDYAENGRLHGAYGARIKTQIPAAIEKLHNDMGSRQAVVTLWDEYLDNRPGHKDYPCTVALQFEVDETGRLCMNVFMRSNDVWLGLPYDLFQFSQLHLTMATSMQLVPGWYRHTTMSLHVYERDVENVEAIDEPTSLLAGGLPLGIGRPGEPMVDVMKNARRLLVGCPGRTYAEDWYAKTLYRYTHSNEATKDKENETDVGRDVDDGRADDRKAIPVQP